MNLPIPGISSLLILAPLSWCAAQAPAQPAKPDISDLDQHFNDPGKDVASWTFVPKENVREFSTEEHPGRATIYEAGAGRDVKGIPKDPIRLGDYACPGKSRRGWCRVST